MPCGWSLFLEMTKALLHKADTLAIRNRELQDMLDISHAKYLAAMNLLLENGLYSVEQPSAQVIDLNEKDNAVRPTFDDPMTKDM